MCVCRPERCVIRVLDFNHANGATENRGPAEHKTGLEFPYRQCLCLAHSRSLRFIPNAGSA